MQTPIPTLPDTPILRCLRYNELLDIKSYLSDSLTRLAMHKVRIITVYQRAINVRQDQYVEADNLEVYRAVLEVLGGIQTARRSVLTQPEESGALVSASEVS